MIDLLKIFRDTGINYPSDYRDNCYLKLDKQKYLINEIILFEETTRIDIYPIGADQALFSVDTSIRYSGIIVSHTLHSIDSNLCNYELYCEIDSDIVKLSGVCFSSVEYVFDKTLAQLYQICWFEAVNMERNKIADQMT